MSLGGLRQIQLRTRGQGSINANVVIAQLLLDAAIY